MQAVLGPTGFLTTAVQSLPDLSLFPSGAWTLGFPFALLKPYLSQDDREFHILDNPVRKEWVFHVPYIAPSQWKGALRAAMRQLRGYTSWEQEAKDEQMIRLFGNVKGEESAFSAGWLHFYPTYFDRIGLEVINPHPRDTGAGKQPIYFECVPAGTKGNFTLLYVPLGEVTKEEMEADFWAVAQGLKAMFRVYGFGAKTSSGFGRAKVHEEQVEIRPEGLKAEWERVWGEGESYG
jgi:CRISPR-associated protein Cmr2